MEHKGIIGVGSPLVDLLAHVSEEFLGGVHGEKGGMELIDGPTVDALVQSIDGDTVMAPGGSAANTVYGLAMLEYPTAFLGMLGHDDPGVFYRKSLLAEGVDHSRFKIDIGTPTGMCVSLVTPDSERTCRTFLGAATGLDPNDISVEDFLGYQHAHIEGYLVFNQSLVRHILECAAEADCAVSLDLASFEVVRGNHEFLVDVLDEYVDVVFANEDESHAFCGSHDPEAGVAALAQHCETVAVKVGAAGSYLKRGDERVFVEAVPTQAFDTTGAGDLYASGFLYGLYRGLSLADCGHIGAVLGSEVVRQLGARIPEPRWNHVRNLISSLKNNQ